MSLNLGLLALLEAAPGKEAELEAFLVSGRAVVEDEAGTIVWYAFKMSDSTFGIFDAFEDDASRQAHIGGRIPAGLPGLVGAAPDIRLVDILAVK